MKVLFIEDVMGTAYAGDIKEVKPGFARNYLFPGKLAVAATPDQMSRVERLRSAAGKRRVAAESEMKGLADKLNGQVVRIEARAGRNNRLYGSITNVRVAEELSKLAGREIDRRRVIMDSFRLLGNYTVPVKLHPGIEPKVTVVVAAPEGMAPVEEPTAEEIVQEVEAEKAAKREASIPTAAPVAEAEAAEGEEAEESAK
ncbi:MAG: 50S ribosomal protein L9 [Chloroflexi bacterium]|nr:50S ribosomal protein L9 [Chloroflexota bacterium]